MDRGACRATVHGVAELDTAEHTCTQATPGKGRGLGNLKMLREG